MKNFSLKNFGGTALTTTLIATMVVITPSWAEKNCSLADLKGKYGYSEQGVSISNNGTTYISEAGLITADGKGNLSATALASWAPFTYDPPLKLVFSTAIPGKGYTVNPDCTGDATFDVTVYDNGNNMLFKLTGRTIHFVLDSKDDFKFVSTTPGTVATGSANKQ